MARIALAAVLLALAATVIARRRRARARQAPPPAVGRGPRPEATQVAPPDREQEPRSAAPADSNDEPRQALTELDGADAPQPAPAPDAAFVSVGWKLVAAPADRAELTVDCHQDDALELDRVDVQETATQVFVTAVARRRPRPAGAPPRAPARVAAPLSRPLGDRELIAAPVDAGLSAEPALPGAPAVGGAPAAGDAPEDAPGAGRAAPSL